jgi:D-glycero-alpha-D-manno-heptose-7-phosphate kinase
LIVSRTPFRVTLGGGGTDLPSYYEQHGGFVFAMGIDKYMYVACNPPAVDRHIRVQYTKGEIVWRLDQLQHDLAREALQRHGILSQIEISSLADLRSGTGLGSASCYLVALLAALRAYKQMDTSPRVLAEEACEIELGVLRRPVGKQDQYLAAFGGMTILEIDRQGRVEVRAARVNCTTLPTLLANTQLYWTGVNRNVPEILRDQDAAMRSGGEAHDVVEGALHGIREIGRRILAAIEAEDYDEFGRLMDEHWQLKQRMSPRITLPGIAELYAEAKRRFGVLGGKLSGAGGGGFFIVYAPHKHSELDAFMARAGLRRMQYGLELDGARIVCNSSSPSMGRPDHAANPREP